MDVTKADTGRGSVVTGRATQQPKRIFGCEIHFKHDFPPDIESINQKLQIKKFIVGGIRFTCRFRIIDGLNRER